MGTIDTLLRVKADASGAVSGLKPLQASLQQTATDAQKTETALNDLGGQHTITLNDQAIQTARAEIERLRNTMREQLAIDPKADTREAQRRIGQLQRSIKTLDETDATVDVAVVADTTGLLALKAALAEVQTGFVEGAVGGLAGKSSIAASAVRLLGTSGVAAAAGILAVGAAAGIAAKQAWDLGLAAADVETSVSQLDALTKGQGAETFANLQTFAATTPFELDEVTAATKRLVAAGVDLTQIPAYLTDIGNVAAATGVPLEQIATIFAQMESSGKAQFENVQQLAEAGIPVWQTLADKLGLSVAQVQKLATEGKLGADTIDLLRVSLGEQFPTAMTDQAETFNGMMSTLSDTMTQMQAQLGTLFLPTMKEVIGVMQDLANIAEQGVEWLVEFNDWVDKITGKDIVGNLLGSIPGVGPLITALGDSEEETAAKTAKAKLESDALAASIELVASSSAQANQDIQDHADKMDQLEQSVQDTSQAYQDLKDSFTAFNDGLIEGRDHVYDYQGALDTLGESLQKGNTFSPDLEQGRTNWDNLTAFAETASNRIQDTFETKGAGAATALSKSFRQTLAQLLIDAGIKGPQAWRLVDQVLEKPHQIKMELGEIDDSKLTKQLQNLRLDRANIKTQFVIPEGATEKDAQKILDQESAALKPINAKINTHLDKLHQGKAEDDLDDTANPGGKPRKARIDAKVNTTQATIDLDNFIKLRRTTNVHVQLIYDTPGGQFFGPPSASPQAAPQTAGPAGLRAAGAAMLSSPTPTATIGPWSSTGVMQAAQPAATDQVTHIRPKQVPVQVFLDGVEIATRIEARRAMVATTSVRRTA